MLSASYSSVVLSDHPAVFWRLGDSTGTTAVDATGNGANGTYVNGVTPTLPGPVVGDTTAAASFNGINQYVQLPSNPLGGDFTIEAWIKTSATGLTGSQGYQGNPIFWADVAGVHNDSVLSVLNDRLAFFTGNPDDTITGTTPLNDGQFHYVVATRLESGVKEIYVDGKLEATGSTNNNPLNENPDPEIGGNTLDNRYFNGVIADVAVYPSALPDARIAAHYQTALAAPPTAHDATATTREDTPVVVPVLSSASDPNGSPLTVTGVSSPTAAGGTAVLNADGTVTYTPATHYVGADSFTFTVRNAYGDTASARVLVTVVGVAHPPTLAVADAAGKEGTPIPLNISAALTDTGGSETLSLTVSGVPAGAALSRGTNQGGGVWALTPADLPGLTLTAPEKGAFTLHVTATARETVNGDAASVERDLHVTVRNVPPVATVAGPTGGVPGQPLTFTLKAADPSAVDQAAGFTFRIDWGDGSVQTVTGPSGARVDHTYTRYATYTVRVTATDDGGGVSAPASESIKVTPWVVQQQPDPLDPTRSLRVLVIGVGTEEGTIHVSPAGSKGISITAGEDDSAAGGQAFVALPIDRIVIYVRGDDDAVAVSHGLAIPIEVHAVPGDDGGGGQHNDCGHDDDQPTLAGTNDGHGGGAVPPPATGGGNQSPAPNPGGGSGGASPAAGTHHGSGRHGPRRRGGRAKGH